MSAGDTPLPRAGWRTELVAFAKKHQLGRRWEQIYPLVCGGACGIACGWAASKWSITDTNYAALVKDVLPVIVSVASVLAGFQAAGQAIMVSVIASRSRAIAFMRGADTYKLLTKYIWEGLALLMLAIALATAVLVVRSVAPDFKREWTQPVVVGLLAAAFVASFLASYRIMRLMVRLLEDPGAENVPAPRAASGSPHQ
jgi:hypothetical protein